MDRIERERERERERKDNRSFFSTLNERKGEGILREWAILLRDTIYIRALYGPQINPLLAASSNISDQ